MAPGAAGAPSAQCGVAGGAGDVGAPPEAAQRRRMRARGGLRRGPKRRWRPRRPPTDASKGDALRRLHPDQPTRRHGAQDPVRRVELELPDREVEATGGEVMVVLEELSAAQEVEREEVPRR